jgi:uncharacterized protein YbbC (DUF1343 family)
MRVVLGIIVLSYCFFSCKNRQKRKSRQNSAIVAQNSNEPIKDNSANTNPSLSETITLIKKFENGDLQLDKYLPLLKNKSVGIVANQSSMLRNTHLIDTLLTYGINVKKIFAPEHGIRGSAENGELINSSVDSKTGIPIISLYGTHKKPTQTDLDSLDIVVFDLQDVGVRFYTYISTMHFMMEACAEKKIPMVILDRPNPNGDYVDGPVLDTNYRSFIGMHPIPIVHGLTVGELALMINGEYWLKDSLQTDLKVIKCKNYTHDSIIPLTIKPSPNLPNLNAIRWYPSICFFEETQVSVGRGTYNPFEMYGSPFLSPTHYKFKFIPISIEGMSKNPPFLGKECYGEDLQKEANTKKIRYDIWVDVYKDYKSTKSFFSSKNFTYKLCGTDKIVKALEEGKNAKQIAQLFEDELITYKLKRKIYLLYPDFKE